MGFFEYDDAHLPPSPAPVSGRIRGEILPAPGEKGEFRLVIRDQKGAVVCDTTATSTNGEPAPVDCPHNLSLTEVTQRNLTDQVAPGSSGIMRPVWLR